MRMVAPAPVIHADFSSPAWWSELQRVIVPRFLHNADRRRHHAVIPAILRNLAMRAQTHVLASRSIPALRMPQQLLQGGAKARRDSG